MGSRLPQSALHPGSADMHVETPGWMQSADYEAAHACKCMGVRVLPAPLRRIIGDGESALSMTGKRV